MSVRVVAIIQARLGSTRLPGKVLRPLGGRPMVDWVIDRTLLARRLDAVVVATTENPADAPLVHHLEARGDVSVFRGAEHDVLARYRHAAAAAGADVVVRITSDCPLIDPDVIDRCVEALAADPQVAFSANHPRRTFPRGLDTEVFRRDALERAFREATSASDREHVTPYLWKQPEQFPALQIVDPEDHSDLRWTVDTPEDFELIRRIAEAFGGNPAAFRYRDVLALLAAHPDWCDLNRHVEQKRA